MCELFCKLAFLFLISGCASSAHLENKTMELPYVMELKVDQTSASEAVKKFGSPSKKDVTNDGEAWTYLEESTGDQRLVLTFYKNSNILRSVLWVPLSNEPENNLKYLVSRFPNMKLEKVSNEDINPHLANNELTYRDEKSGQVIVGDKLRSNTVGVAWYSLQERDVTSTPDKNKIKAKSN